jgi:signal recognition particle subunit SRP72
VLTSIDVDLLETSNWSLGAKYVKKTTKADTPIGNTNDSKDKKKKRKKKKKLPKNYDPKAEVDPERWLPRYERSTFKKKKDKRGAQGVGKGTQGAVGDIDIKPSQRTVTSNAITSSPQGPRQQRPTQKKKKKTGRK